MADKITYASECFNSGLNCAQSVFTSYCDESGLSKEQATKLACAFGAGISHLGEVCGAVSGALMVLGSIYGPSDKNEVHKKALTNSLANEFAKRFKIINGTINCSELLNYDLSNDAQVAAAKQADIFRQKCPKFIKDAVTILEEIIAEQNEKMTG
ncbi:MAG TPA: C_GCAxxG_C_C family protein [Clostridiaceae bacterium]|jgi:C_GCAxxG_C_C family probable redox protein|nr:C_GCAxxG_C_C family protein [Clostridiaceae bacterium]